MQAYRRCRLALAEGDAIAAAPILAILRGAGHACRRFASGAAALVEIERERFDVLLLARAMPDMAAADLIASVRARLGYRLPVIGLAGHVDELAAMLDEGADDCLARPVSPLLLLAQVNASLRRAMPGTARIDATVGHLTFQPEGTKVYVDERAVSLTAKEYALALALCRSLGRPLDRDHLLRTIWGGRREQRTRTLDVHISRLRAKLELRPDRGFRLEALYGRGYRLDHGAAGAPFSPPRSASPSAQAAAGYCPAAR